MSIKLQMNPSTLKVLYNSDSTKIQYMCRGCITEGDYEMEFAGITKCAAESWPSDPNGATFELTQVWGSMFYGTYGDWHVTMYCFYPATNKLWLITLYYIDGTNYRVAYIGTMFSHYCKFDDIANTLPEYLCGIETTIYTWSGAAVEIKLAKRIAFGGTCTGFYL